MSYMTYAFDDGIPHTGLDLDILFGGSDGERPDGAPISAYDIWQRGRTAWVVVSPSQLRAEISRLAADLAVNERMKILTTEVV